MRTPELQQYYDEHYRESDVIINTLPKTGQTLLQFMIVLLKRKGNVEGLNGIFSESPWLEMNFPQGDTEKEAHREDPKKVFELWEALPSPRVFKAHVQFYEVC